MKELNDGLIDEVKKKRAQEKVGENRESRKTRQANDKKFCNQIGN